MRVKPVHSDPDDFRVPPFGADMYGAARIWTYIRLLKLRERPSSWFPRACAALSLISLALIAGACGSQGAAKTADAVEIIYPKIPVTDGLQELQLKFHVDTNYLADRILPNYSGPPLVAINYKNMKPGTVIPYQNPEIVLASAMLPIPKVPDYRSVYMDQPFAENFEWFKDTGQKKFALIHKIYRVVDVPQYPASDLYLKEQKYHDFYIFCGLNKNPEQDLCILGKQININQKDGGKPYTVNLDIRFDKRSISDWAIIELQLTKYFTERLEVEVARGTNDG